MEIYNYLLFKKIHYNLFLLNKNLQNTYFIINER